MGRSEGPFTDDYKRLATNVPAGFLWQYRMHIRGDYPQPEHVWMLTNETGGIHVTARWTSFDGRSEWSGGIETHSPSRPDYVADDAPPHHETCWVIGKPCWHDGTSLGFSEQIAPYLSSHTNAFDESDHQSVLSVMLRYHRSHFAKEPTS